ncbi:MAG: hypothetical protein K2Y21_05595 [Phycisphaerales bacterium]|nr:hypothetical protein [Phycisphaerales bacterium]
MIYPSIRIEGSILSPDLIDRLEELPGQRPADFGLDSGTKVKDEIARAWADAQDYWRIFHRKLEALRPDSPATTETRNLWIVPLLGLLKYDLEFQKAGAELNGKTYAISHRITNRGQTPVHVVGYRDPAGLDRKPANATLRMSAHAVVQEYLNLSEQLYGLVTNGRVLRLLRDSSRLIKQTYVEFDLDRIFTDGLFADFAVLFRLLHASRLPQSTESAAESIVERYHQDSLDSGARIREGLSRAVEEAIRCFANGFLAHPANNALRNRLADGSLKPDAFYKSLLRLIYRLLFLMVIEERGLVFPTSAKPSQRSTYEQYYSVQRLRRLAEKRYLADGRHNDLWLALVSAFRLFDADGPGPKLGLKPLAGDLFSYGAIGELESAHLSNAHLLSCLRSLGLYTNPVNGQLIRVNYAALNVEEFGSVYEGLLEYEPSIDLSGTTPVFDFKPGDERAATGSHYTPDDLVQPLIKHSLDHLIAERLKAKDPAAALLDLRVADIACGSGHILLAAARRIATELAIVRTGEEQPSPASYRAAIRDVIRTCIYGVDLNPLAVELCKVALWLEAHNPGEPLNFLDHHIKCGNAIVGFVRQEQVDAGVPDEAFAKLPGDDPDLGKEVRARNKRERKERATGQAKLAFTHQRQTELAAVLDRWRTVTSMPETTPAEIDAKKNAFESFSSSGAAFTLRNLASIPIAQFYIPRTLENADKLITDERFRDFWSGRVAAQGQAPAAAFALAHRKRFFHWFLEFPEIIQRGGFNCILGNPPYLGGNRIANRFGVEVAEFLKAAFECDGNSNFVINFMLRAWTLLHAQGNLAMIASQSIKEGTSRTDGLQRMLSSGGTITYAKRNVRWPGRAATDVDLVALAKGPYTGRRLLDDREVQSINSALEAESESPEPISLPSQESRSYVGVALHGDGFLLSPEEATILLGQDQRCQAVVRPFLIGDDLISYPTPTASRFAIDFSDLDESEAQRFEAAFRLIEERVRPERAKNKRASRAKYWWHFGEKATGLQRVLATGQPYLVTAKTAKHLAFFRIVGRPFVLDQSLTVLALDDWESFGVVQSQIHEAWARGRSSNQGGTPRYNASTAFATFAFPWMGANASLPALREVAEFLYQHRSMMMREMSLGITDIYNLFHSRDPEAGLKAHFAGRTVKSNRGVSIPSEHREQALATTYEQSLAGLLELRRLHVALDTVVRDAYGWQSLDLQHDFYEVETLPENDRVRYTISPVARKEVLKRLLALNHERAKAEQAAAAPAVAKPARAKRASAAAPVEEMTVFDQAFPNSSVDWETAAWMLALVRAAPRRGIAFYMACMTAATSPDLCEQILGQSRKQETKRLMSKAPLAKLPNGTRVPFAAALRWASTTKAIGTSASMDDAQPGPTFPRAVKEPEMPALDAALVALVIEVAEHATDATHATQPWRQVFDQRRLLVG